MEELIYLNMQSSPAITHSPSFNSYSSGKLAKIAARVVEEFRAESCSNEDDDDIFNFNNEEDQFSADQQHTEEQVKDNEEEAEEDEEFQFAVVYSEPDSSPISADDIFYNGQIRPVYPLFDRSLLLGDSDLNTASSIKPPVRLSLRKLFIEERDSASCSSSEADDLDGISPGTYCVWTPKSSAKETCKKSNSTGNSSKRWKFRDLLHRSNSDDGGKDTFVFFTPLIAKKRNEKVEKSTSGATDVVPATTKPHNRMKKSTKESDQRRSFLPYRQDLVGLITNVNGLSRNLHPF